MTKLQSLTAIILGIMAAFALMSAAILIMPLAEHYRYLTAAFLMPLVGCTLIVWGVRSKGFVSLSATYSGLIVASLVLIFVMGPLTS